MEYINNDLVADEQQKMLPKLKEKVESAHKYFKPCYRRFNEFRKFVFETSVEPLEEAVNEQKSFPKSEFNLCNAYISRLCGEFAKQEPSIEVMAADGEPIDKETIEFLEGHFRHLLDEAESDGTQYQTYRDSLSGGFSQLRAFTEYLHAMSFDQVIRVRKGKYPTMSGFDPMANTPHKGDGEFSFSIYPMREDEFKVQYKKANIENLNFTRDVQSFSWSFNNGLDNIILICELALKKKKKVTIMRLVDENGGPGKTITKKEYKKILEEWDDVTQPPGIYGEPRSTLIETIYRYTFIENQIIKYEKTDFAYLPDVFVDGDSVDLYEENSGKMQQFTRPYILHAKGAQNLKNLSTQALMNQIENQVMHKFIIKKEAIPDEEDYIDFLTNYQKAGLLVVNAFMNNEPNSPIPDPIQPVIIPPCPPEILQGITMADNIMQAVLGSFNAAAGEITSNVAQETVVDAITQSNNTAMPYVVNYMQSLNQLALIVLDLIPKYYKTPRTLPMMNKNGERSFVRVNDEKDPNSINLKYDPNALHVKIRPGVNFAIQKSRALRQITAMMQASESFAHFMNAKGLEVLIDNFEIRGTDILKELAKEYQEEQKKAAQEQKEMEMKMAENTPAMLKVKVDQAKLMQKSQQDDKSNALKDKELEIKKQSNAIQQAVLIDKAEAEKLRAMADMGVKAADMSHKHAKEHHELKHGIDMDHKKHDLEERKHEHERSKPVESKKK